MTHEFGRIGINSLKLLSRGQAILADRANVFTDLGFQARHTNHIEFIEIIGGDGEKSETLEQWMSRVLALTQNPLVERQPRDFTVKEPIW